MYCLQSRWKLERNALVYYGLRNRENLFRNRVRLRGRQREILARLPADLNEAEQHVLRPLLGEQVVEEQAVRPVPRSFSEARFCRCCAANDFMIPGLEFDETGLCPLCQTADRAASLKSVLPLVREIPHAKQSRFDVAVFYTGGKDSAFLLYQLAKVRGLRVLALTWEIPYQSDNARQSIENAKRCFDTVEFISRRVSAADLRRFYETLYRLAGNTCACPSLAYLLFFPELVANRVPYFVAGNEPVQMLGLYYNHMAPRLAYSFADNRPLALLCNLGRLLTLRPPLKRGQLQTLVTMRQLAGGNRIARLTPYRNELVGNVVEAIRSVPEFLPPLKRTLRYASRTGQIPAFVHLDFNELCGGNYDWNRVRDTLTAECGWVPPADGEKSLHTSCRIERCKDYSQFRRFRDCESRTIPFSALEIALASRQHCRPREELIRELETSLGFLAEEPPECEWMHRCLRGELL